MVNNPQLTKIKQLLEDKFIPQNQQLVEEVGVDDNGDAFVMQRKVGSSRSVDYFICRFDPNNNSKFFPMGLQIMKAVLDCFDNNDFAIVDELPFSIKEGTEEGSFRPDINILINGIPLAFLEVKHPDNSGGIQVEFERMINKRLKNDDYKKYFNLIQIVSFSNNMEYEESDDDVADEVKAGSFYTTPNGQATTFSFFREDIKEYHARYQLKDIDEETIKYVVKDGGYNPEETDTPEFQTNMSDVAPCNRFITSFYDKERFMYMLRYGIMFLTEVKKIHNATTNKDEEVPIKQKHIMRYPQFFATRAIIKRLGEKDKNGIIWHTQGSGKTALSAYANRVIKDFFAKKNINTKFFFVVDRLDLMKQATTEFSNRGFNVINVSNKNEFAKELKKPLNSSNDGVGTICIVNIQKLMEESKMPKVENVYDVKVQRIFFVDEAHRSYNLHGEFFKNLMTCDTNGIYIAMTGTPLLTKKERSNLKFGDYIHKYFYDKSIADGYTLRIKKEQIDTTAKAEIRENLELENKSAKVLSSLLPIFTPLYFIFCAFSGILLFFIVRCDYNGYCIMCYR